MLFDQNNAFFLDLLRDSRQASRSFSAVVCFGLLLIAPLATAQIDSVQSPGALQPQLDRENKPVETQSPLSIPPVYERATDSAREGKQAFRVAGFDAHYYPEVALDSVDQSAVQNIFLSYLQENGSQLTLSQCQDVADLVSYYFQEKGYFLARAIVPAQRVEKNRVKIQIMTGALGAVSADTSLYRNAWPTHVFDRALDQHVEQGEMESLMLRVNDLPGLSANGVFSAGAEIGQTQLRIMPNQEDKTEFSLRADNYGLDSSGEYRLIASAKVNNITGNADSLSLTALAGIDPDNSHYGALNYTALLPGLIHSVAFDLSRNDYDIDGRFAPLRIEGETDVGAITVRSQWVRQRAINFATEIGLAVKQANSDIPDFSLLLEDNLTVASAGLLFDLIDTRFKGINQGSVHYYRGLNSTMGAISRNGESNLIRTGQSGDFEKYHALFSRVQTLSRQQSLWWRVRGQYSSNVLSSLEQMSLGGPYSVRAYPVSEFVRDRAVFTSVAWNINAPGFADRPAYGEYDWGDLLTFSLFVDYAQGELNGPALQGEERVELSGVGGELSWTFPDRGYATLSLASPLTDRDASDSDDPQFWIVVGIDF